MLHRYYCYYILESCTMNILFYVITYVHTYHMVYHIYSTYLRQRKHINITRLHLCQWEKVLFAFTIVQTTLSISIIGFSWMTPLHWIFIKFQKVCEIFLYDIHRMLKIFVKSMAIIKNTIKVNFLKLFCQ